MNIKEFSKGLLSSSSTTPSPIKERNIRANLDIDPDFYNTYSSSILEEEEEDNSYSYLNRILEDYPITTTSKESKTIKRVSFNLPSSIETIPNNLEDNIIEDLEVNTSFNSNSSTNSTKKRIKNLSLDLIDKSRIEGSSKKNKREEIDKYFKIKEESK
ncbi:hypothetical protein BDY17DRAFT_314247 [Neohortaea acidophila]|uniref:Uncharacterized protein n=1 Tax=Neohortaea acidophila TaxID=245834 RepID=A0A6A6PFI9_9PEZI|nr:uncharacterized protein BDY17DRAFT_314247 [Neohortaea acidophila]KAF2478423.1 hypothetical protein BDY17DRAFT_314247 [Neohortaea acidophila]